MCMTKVVDQIQNTMSQALHKSKGDAKPISVGDLTATITQNQFLWNECCTSLRRNNIFTSVSAKEHLLIFLEENRKIIEEQHTILQSRKKEVHSNTKMTTKVSDHLDKIKSAWTSTKSASNNFFNMVLQSCKNEVSFNEQAQIY